MRKRQSPKKDIHQKQVALYFCRTGNIRRGSHAVARRMFTTRAGWAIPRIVPRYDLDQERKKALIRYIYTRELMPMEAIFDRLMEVAQGDLSNIRPSRFIGRAA